MQCSIRNEYPTREGLGIKQHVGGRREEEKGEGGGDATTVLSNQNEYPTKEGRETYANGSWHTVRVSTAPNESELQAKLVLGPWGDETATEAGSGEWAGPGRSGKRGRHCTGI